MRHDDVTQARCYERWVTCQCTCDTPSRRDGKNRKGGMLARGLDDGCFGDGHLSSTTLVALIDEPLVAAECLSEYESNEDEQNCQDDGDRECATIGGAIGRHMTPHWTEGELGSLNRIISFATTHLLSVEGLGVEVAEGGLVLPVLRPLPTLYLVLVVPRAGRPRNEGTV